MTTGNMIVSNRKGGVPAPLLGIIGVALFLVVLFFLGRGGSKVPTGITLYYGEGCLHCRNVEQFLEENDVRQKVSFEQKEVWSNQENAQEMRDVAKSCGLPIDSLGVPFLWTGTGCLVGDKDIINFFQKKL
jgi:glutaredoxin